MVQTSALGRLDLFHQPKGEGLGPGDSGPLLVQRYPSHTRGLPALEVQGALPPWRVLHQAATRPGMVQKVLAWGLRPTYILPGKDAWYNARHFTHFLAQRRLVWVSC